MQGFPAEVPLEFSRIGAEYRWISRASWSHTKWNFGAGDFLNSAYHFANRVTTAIADVVRDQSWRPHSIQCQEMGCRNIADMNIVAHTGAVGRVVIVSIQGKEIALTSRSLKQERNDMRFGLVSFSRSLGGARSIEIAQRHNTPAISGCVPLKRSFQH